MKASDNVFLTLNLGVKLTPVTEAVIVGLEPYFREAGLHARVTRCLSDAYDQLKIIQHYLSSNGLASKYPEAMNCTNPAERSGGLYVWQMAWSNLLNIGVIINPPLRAKCLMNYYGPTGDGPNKIGQEINQTPHVTGNCLDIGGKGGLDATINDELVPVQNAAAKKLPGLVKFLPERKNNAIHIDCKKI